MAFQFKRSESADHAVQRVAREQVDSMIAEVDAAGQEHATVHNVRKRCKKLRGLIRLVRPQFKGGKTYPQENASYRDAARLLSFMRDAQSIIESYDALVKCYPDEAGLPQIHTIRERLVERREAVAHDDSNMNERIGEFRGLMVKARERIGRWKFRASGFAMLEEGLEKTYSLGRCNMKQAFARPSTESFHEWRKHMKYHWYHCRLLKGIWKDSMKTRIAAARELSELLGDDHDLAVLREAQLNDQVDLYWEYTGTSLVTYNNKESKGLTGAETIENKDGRVVSVMGDDQRFEYVYKFVTHGRFDPERPAASRASTATRSTGHRARWIPCNRPRSTPASWSPTSSIRCIATATSRARTGSRPTSRSECPRYRPTG